MAKSSKKMSPMITVIVTGAICLVTLAAAYLFGAFDHDEFIPIDDVYVVDDDTLFVAGVSGKDSDTDRYRFSRIALLDLDGTMHDVVRQDGPLEVIGVSDDLVWLKDRDHGYHARTLPNLELVTGIGEAVNSHPVLSNRAQAKGITDDALVVLGADNKKYEVGRDGTIEKLGDDVEFTPKERRRPAHEPTMSEADVRALLAKLRDTDDVNSPSPVMGQRTPGPVKLADPDSILAVSFEFVVGGQSQAIHRLSPDGKAIWSASTEQLMDSFKLEGQGILARWVGLRDGKVVALLQLSDYSTYDGDDYTQHMQRIVEIDPKTGTVTGSHDVVVPKAS